MKTLKYLKFFLLILIPALLIALPCYGQENDPTTYEFWDGFVDDWMHGELKSIKSFGFIEVKFAGIEEEKRGLDKRGLTKFIKFKYMNNFAGFPYKDAMDLISGQLAALLNNEHKKVKKIESELRNIGSIGVKVSVIGDDRSRIVAYHVELEVGICPGCSRKNMVPVVYSNALLGLGMADNLEKHIKDAINSLIESFAFTFFDIRGKL